MIISDRLERLPFDNRDVLFVRGPILQQETYRRARLQDARMVIVLATSYEDPNSDAIVASAVAVVESLNRQVYSVAECLNYKHRMLFDSVHTNALVYSMRVTGNLLSLEAHDTGVSALVNTITSNRDGATLFSIRVDDSRPETTFRELAKRLLDHEIHLLGVLRDGESVLAFGDMRPQHADRVLYVGPERLEWQTLWERAEVAHNVETAP